MNTNKPKLVTAIKTGEYEILLPDWLTTPEMLAEWERTLWDLPKGADSIIEGAAEQIMRGMEQYNQDGYGVIRDVTNREFDPECRDIQYKEIYVDIEFE